MKIPGFGPFVLGLVATAATLSACSGGASQSSFGPPTPMQRNSHRGTWMAPNAKSKTLLYVSGYTEGQSRIVGIVEVYDFKTGAVVGQLTGFETPVGQCTDKAGDVYVVDQGVSGGSAFIYEYAHGRTEPIKTLYDSYYNNYALGCSVDPTTGNLALTDRIYGILIYKNASGRPKAYTIPSCSCVYYPPAYDSKGNVFTEYESYPSDANGVAVLPGGGGSSLTRLFLRQPATRSTSRIGTTRRAATLTSHLRTRSSLRKASQLAHSASAVEIFRIDR